MANIVNGEEGFFVNIERKSTRLINKRDYEVAEREATSFNRIFNVGDQLIYKELPVTVKYAASVICAKPVVWFNEVIGPVNLNEVLVSDDDLIKL